MTSLPGVVLPKCPLTWLSLGRQWAFLSPISGTWPGSISCPCGCLCYTSGIIVQPPWLLESWGLQGLFSQEHFRATSLFAKTLLQIKNLDCKLRVVLYATFLKYIWCIVYFAAHWLRMAVPRGWQPSYTELLSVPSIGVFVQHLQFLSSEKWGKLLHISENCSILAL